MAGPEGMPALKCPMCGTAGQFFVDTEPAGYGQERPCAIECVACCSSWTTSGEPREHYPAVIADEIARREARERAAATAPIPGQIEIELPDGG